MAHIPLIMRSKFVLEAFIEGGFEPTPESDKRRILTIDGRACAASILEPLRQAEYAGMQRHFMKKSHAFLIVYNIASRKSFEEVQMFHEEIRGLFGGGDGVMPPVTLVGNKCDLEGERVVHTWEGLELEEGLRLQAFVETSAKMGDHVQQVFHGVVRMAMRKEEMEMVTRMAARRRSWQFWK